VIGSVQKKGATMAKSWKKTLLATAASSGLTIAAIAGFLWVHPASFPSSSIEVRSIDDLRPYTVPGSSEFLFRNYRIAKTFSEEDYRSLPPASWTPRPVNGNLDDVIPDPWPKAYLEVHKQNFNPGSFPINVNLLCNYLSSHPESREAIASIFNALMGRLLEYSFPVGDALFVRYDFRFPRATYILEPGWVSGIGNGFALRGLMRIYDCTGEQRSLDLADKFANAFKIINTGSKSAPWFSYVDDFGFLWFDEYPSPDGRASFVLNGHIHATLGLLAYYRKRPEEWVLRMVQGGITTVREYVHLYRRNGKVNRYALSDWHKPDYSPARTPRQQRHLYQITGDPYFAATAKAFEQDMIKGD